jgi:ribonuclease VapC
MVLDTSVIVAIVLKEPGYETLIDKIGLARAVAVGTPTLLECAMVLTSRMKQDARLVVNGLVRTMNAQVIPFTEEHYDTAVEAFLKFGRGRHAAALNFGDCMSYALAAVAGVPLLFTGNDFARTDITAA